MGQQHSSRGRVDQRSVQARRGLYGGERGIPRAWGPGRHLFGNNLFSYCKDPESNTVEYTAEVEQITDPNRQPRVMESYADQWRTARSG
jgi:hypothetical protein